MLSRLRDLRKEKGYTQIKMQMLTGIDQSDYPKLSLRNVISPSSSANASLWL